MNGDGDAAARAEAWEKAKAQILFMARGLEETALSANRCAGALRRFIDEIEGMVVH